MATSLHLKDAKDLTREPPRSPRLRLGGYAIMARMIDKGRATLNGAAGDYHFACPMDSSLFDFKGVSADEVRQVIASGAGDNEILDWIDRNGQPKTAAEIKAWSAGSEAARPYDNPEKREWFTGECQRLGLDPARTTLFEYLDVDDRKTFSAPPR